MLALTGVSSRTQLASMSPTFDPRLIVAGTTKVPTRTLSLVTSQLLFCTPPSSRIYSGFGTDEQDATTRKATCVAVSDEERLTKILCKDRSDIYGYLLGQLW